MHIILYSVIYKLFTRYSSLFFWKHGPGLAYVELEFVEQKDESKVQQIHGAENTVDYSELDHDKMKPDNNDCYFWLIQIQSYPKLWQFAMLTYS